MSCTRPRRSSDRGSGSRRDAGGASRSPGASDTCGGPRRSRARGVSPLLAAALAAAILVPLAGCASKALVHPSFDALQPRIIDVRPVENATVRPLDRISFGGLAQRLITGPREYDVLGLLHHGLLQVLEEKGYSAEPGLSVSHSPGVDFRALRGEALDAPFDAVLFTRILSWSVSRVTTTRVSLQLRVELYGVPGGELLFEHEVKGFLEDEDPASDGTFLVPGLRRVAYRALADLPRRESLSGRPSPASGRRNTLRTVAE